MRPFHMAFPVRNLTETRDFYVDVLGCRVGRTDPKWIDFDFFGHQLSAHLRPQELTEVLTNAVDGDAVPVRHFGVILDMDTWKDLAQRPTCRF